VFLQMVLYEFLYTGMGQFIGEHCFDKCSV
jgi:hypothetical protein